jgi:hypothetical protein
VTGAAEVVDPRPVVVAAIPLKPAVRERLERLLGAVRVVDIRDPVLEADLVLAPPCSPQAIGRLKQAYPTARVVVAELEDWASGIHLGGPVLRLRNAGADAYLVAESLEGLAAQLQVTRQLPPSQGAAERRALLELTGASVDELIFSYVDELLRERERLRREA